MIEQLQTKFAALLQADPELQGAQKVALLGSMRLQQGSLEFSLQDLYVWIEADRLCSYQQFRQQLYQSRFNAWLQQQGYQCVSIGNSAKVDQSRYQLRRM